MKNKESYCKSCEFCFQDGDLVLSKENEYLHAFPDRRGDELDCDTIYELKKEMAGLPIESGKYGIFYEGKFHPIKSIANLDELRVFQRADGRGSRIEGKIRLLE